jgi:hypothetical protein
VVNPLNLVDLDLILTTTSISTFEFDVQIGINDFTVDWGDGTSTSHTGSARVTKDYADTGVYVITISGVFTGFNNESIIAPIESISSWGSTKFSSAMFAFLDSLLTALPSTSLDNFALVTDFVNAWFNCTELTTFPLINTIAGINFTDAWSYCIGLTSFPLINTIAGVNFNRAWFNCNKLTTFPLINTVAGVIFSRAWFNCTGLTSFPLINTIAGVNFNQAWRGCSGLTSFPLINTTAGTNFSFTWQGCTGLTSFPANMFDTCLATNYAFAWQGCTNLTQVSVDNIIISINTANRSNGNLRVDGSTPSASGRAAVDALRARGWFVTVTGY